MHQEFLYPHKLYSIIYNFNNNSFGFDLQSLLSNPNLMLCLILASPVNFITPQVDNNIMSLTNISKERAFQMTLASEHNIANNKLPCHCSTCSANVF